MMEAPPLSGCVTRSERSLTLLCFGLASIESHRVVTKTKSVHACGVRAERGTKQVLSKYELLSLFFLTDAGVQRYS